MLHYTNYTTIQYTTATLHSTTLQLQLQLQRHHTTPHYTTLITLHYSYNDGYNYTTLHYPTLDYTTLYYTTAHSTTAHYATLQYTTQQYTTLITLQQLLLQRQLRLQLQLNDITMHYAN